MSNIKRTAFISDLHLDEKHPAITQLFFAFLNHAAKTMDALYILGDLFEVWIGDDDKNSFHQSIIDAFRMATDQGLPIYFMHGNRDFLLGKKFLRATNGKLLADEEVIHLYGERVLLMHGDTLCTQDVKYLKFRKKARNIFLQKLFLLKSLKKRRQIADNMRAASQMHTANLAMEIMDVTPEAVTAVMKKHQVNYLIHGHTHRPYIHTLTANHPPALRIVLGAWHETGSALTWNERGERELISFTQDTLINSV
jgi:UDP-2,3-diacylglucosamine hydrolase